MSLLVNSLFLISFLDLFAVSLMVPLLSAHIKSLGASHVLVGFASTIYAVLQFFCGPIAGSWSDFKGRQPVLLSSLLICSVCYYALGFASHMLIILCIRIILGTMKHTQALCKAIISDVVHKEAQTKVIGIVYLFVPKTKREKGKRKKTFNESVMVAISNLRSMKWALYWDAFSIKLMLALSLSLLFSNYSLTLQERFSITPSVVGYIISFQSILGAISSFGAGSVRGLYKQGPAKLTQHGFIALAASFFLIIVCSSLWTYLVALAPLAAVSSILRTALSQWSLERAPANRKGSVLGAQHSISAMARMTAPAIAGVAQAAMGPKGPCLISLFASVAGIVIATMVIKKRIRRTKVYDGPDADSTELYTDY